MTTNGEWVSAISAIVALRNPEPTPFVDMGRMGDLVSLIEANAIRNVIAKIECLALSSVTPEIRTITNFLRHEADKVEGYDDKIPHDFGCVAAWSKSQKCVHQDPSQYPVKFTTDGKEAFPQKGKVSDGQTDRFSIFDRVSAKSGRAVGHSGMALSV